LPPAEVGSRRLRIAERACRSSSLKPPPRRTRHAPVAGPFTEAVHERNIEAAVLVDDPGLAAALEYQFSSLVIEGVLKRQPI
jgi:hypothetical protein